METAGNPLDRDEAEELHDRLRKLPIDPANTAKQTGAWRDYQLDCTAVAMLSHLGSEGLDGVVIERSTDFILVRSGGRAELVSVKYREPNRSGAVAWTWSALKQERALIDLYAHWQQHGRDCSVAFWSNAGFTGDAQGLHLVCGLGKPAKPGFVRALAQHLGVTDADASDFLTSLRVPEEPLPRRHDIVDVAIRRTADVVRAYRSDADLTAASCYERLFAFLRDRMSLRPRDSLLRAAWSATLMDASDKREEWRVRSEYVSRKEFLGLLLAEHDRLIAGIGDETDLRPDPLFTGRDSELARLAQMLRPGESGVVAPVVVHGMTGCGKTTLAVQFATIHRNSFKLIWINGSSRTALRQGLGPLIGLLPEDVGADEPATIRRALPANPALLVVIDGITDPSAVAGLIPRENQCRVILTCTASFVELGFASLELGVWTPAEAVEFLGRLDLTDGVDDQHELVKALGFHPLAVAQAATYCRSSRRPIGDYLVVLKESPRLALDKGKLPEYPSTVHAVIELNVREVAHRKPAAYYLLSFLAHIGYEPFDESIFSRPHPRVFVRPGALVPVDKTWKQRIQKLLGKPELKLIHSLSAGAEFADQQLSDPNIRNDAVDLLVGQSLVTRRAGGLTLHPLVAAVVRELAGHPEVWVELGVGLYADELDRLLSGPGETHGHAMAHIATLVAAGMASGLCGNGFMAAACALSKHLVRSGYVPPYETHQQVIEFATRIYDTAKDQGGRGLLPKGLQLISGQALAAVFNHGTDAHAAVTVLQDLRRFARTDPTPEAELLVMVDLAGVAATHGLRQLAADLICEIDELKVRTGKLPATTRATTSHAKTMLLILLGRIDEATAEHERALADAQHSGQVPEWHMAELHGDAAVLARYTGDKSRVAVNELVVLDAARAAWPTRISRTLVAALEDSADGAIDSGNLQLAITLLTEAEEAARTGFGIASREYARVVAVRGRLNLVRRHWLDAETDLTFAIPILREGGTRDAAELAVALVHLSQACNLVGQVDAAATYIDEAIAVDTAVYGPDHHQTLVDREIKNGLQRDRQMQVLLHQFGLFGQDGDELPVGGPRQPVPERADFTGPTYEAMSGRFECAAGEYGLVITWQLHVPGVGINNGLIVGPPQSGKTNALNVLMINAIHSGRIHVIPAAAAWTEQERASWRGVSKAAAEGADSIRTTLAKLSQTIDSRIRRFNASLTDSAPDTPFILLTIDDADKVLAARDVAGLAEAVAVRGPAVGVGVVVTTVTADVTAFGGNENLRRALLNGRRMNLI